MNGDQKAIQVPGGDQPWLDSGYNPVPAEYAGLLLQGSAGLKQIDFPSGRAQNNGSHSDKARGGKTHANITPEDREQGQKARLQQRRSTLPEGFLILDKPLGITSHDAVAKLRRLAGTGKIGHAGTLDPLASGVLVLGLGRATKLMQYAQGKPKTYRARIAFGAVTESEDAATAAVFSAAAAMDPAELKPQILQLLPKFTGDIEQVPSQVSAKKIAGKRAYDLVRAGEKVTLKPVKIRVGAFRLLGELSPLTLPECPQPLWQGEFEITCSSGTYVRALARDLGAALGCGAHLRALRRIRVGHYHVDRAELGGSEYLAQELFHLRDVVAAGQALPLIPTAQVVKSLFPTMQVSWADAKKLVLGQRPEILLPVEQAQVPGKALNPDAAPLGAELAESETGPEENPEPGQGQEPSRIAQLKPDTQLEPVAQLKQKPHLQQNAQLRPVDNPKQVWGLFLAPEYSRSGQEEFLCLAAPRQGTWQVKLGWTRPEELAELTEVIEETNPKAEI